MPPRTTPRFFATPADLRRWFEDNHATAPELQLGLGKKGAPFPSVTYAEALDEALCFGWIDGVTHRIDDTSYTIRFTPRRNGSKWSAVNIRRMAELEAAGRVTPAGLAAFEKRHEARSVEYSYETAVASFTPEQESEFRANPGAWGFWEQQPAGYRRVATFWVTSAKQETTRQRRMQTLIEDSANGLRIALLRREPRM